MSKESVYWFYFEWILNQVHEIHSDRKKDNSLGDGYFDYKMMIPNDPFTKELNKNMLERILANLKERFILHGEVLYCNSVDIEDFEGITKAKKSLFSNLRKKGYIDKNGEITEAFPPSNLTAFNRDDCEVSIEYFKLDKAFSTKKEEIYEILSEHKNNFHIRVKMLNGYEKGVRGYITVKNIEDIHSVVEKISTERKKSEKVVISFCLKSTWKYLYDAEMIRFANVKKEKVERLYCEALLEHLKQSGVISKFKVVGVDNSGLKHTFEISVDWDQFSEFSKDIRAMYKDYLKGKLQINQDDEKMYEIAYDMFSYEVRLIGKGVNIPIAKPNDKSMPMQLMDYIYENPDRDISNLEMAKFTGRPIENINFDKILASLNFKGDLRKAFFKVTKSTIYFRKSITQSQFESLHVPPLESTLK